MLTRNSVLFGLTTVAAAVGAANVFAGPQSPTPVMIVYKTPTCGCCTAWVDHVKQAGFRVVVHDTVDVQPVKDRWGVPAALGSCHTARVGRYIVEGHVPASDIQRMLKEKPAFAGIAAPGMPMGSPGMESPRPEPYDVVSFEKQGKTAIYARH
jgi:hypothetical protein